MNIMYVNFGPAGCLSRCVAGLAVAGAGVLGLLSACGPSPRSADPGTLTPGPGQHQPAGMPGTSARPGMTMSVAPSGRSTAATPVSADTVAIKNFAFAPATLKVRTGTTVTWTNQDTDAHTVTSSGSGGPLHSPTLATHGTYTYTFTKPGSYAYLCAIHPFMTGTVEVTS
ncbi:cupredoxin family copper-binding protein [Streptomyces sp. NPDC052107]|uniref:cupredoxin domain-containing protein n=1 Tax=Streptomyces sp. NPDC052107 TaxID=3155632 RepID=UPI003412192E